MRMKPGIDDSVGLDISSVLLVNKCVDQTWLPAGAEAAESVARSGSISEWRSLLTGDRK